MTFSTIERLGVVSGLKSEPRCLGPLVHIGIRIDGPTLRILAFPGEAAEIVHAPVGLEQIVHARDAFRDVDLAPPSPKAALNGYGTHGNISQFREWRLGKILDTLLFPVRPLAHWRD
jgi:hypothetical protein